MSVIYNIYKADYNPKQDWRNADPLVVNFDQLNKQFDWDDALTADQKFQRVVHRSIDHLYYRDFYSNNKASFGSGNINKQRRALEDQAYVVSLPQSRFGESILPGSVAMSMSMVTYVDGLVIGTPTYPNIYSSTWKIEDDSFGNLVIKSGYVSPMNGTLWTGATSMSLTPVGEFPSPNVYKYVEAGKVSFQEDSDEGLWCMSTEYNNVYAGYIGQQNAWWAVSPGVLNLSDNLGAAWYFDSSVSSSMVIKPGIVPDYINSYNFENGDFTIAAMVIPNGSQTDSIIISKEGPLEELRTDENGNPYTVTTYKKTPYRLSYSTLSGYTFERDGNSTAEYASVQAQPSNSNTPHYVIISKNHATSTISIEIYDTYGSYTDSATYGFTDDYCINPSNIYIGNSYNGTRGFKGYIDNVKFFNKILSTNDKELLVATAGIGNLIVGNVFYNHGMMTVTSNASKFGNIKSIDCRGTYTIWETEISCTVSPGDFGMSSNPTLQQYDAHTNQYVYKPFVTGSHFKPYVTSIGLYDDYGRLLVIGKLNTPIQTPDNMDTTFIVRYDR